MSEERLSNADRARYAGLLVLGSVVFLAVLDGRDGALLMLLASWLLLATAVLLVLHHRRSRS